MCVNKMGQWMEGKPAVSITAVQKCCWQECFPEHSWSASSLQAALVCEEESPAGGDGWKSEQSAHLTFLSLFPPRFRLIVRKQTHHSPMHTPCLFLFLPSSKLMFPDQYWLLTQKVKHHFPGLPKWAQSPPDGWCQPWFKGREGGTVGKAGSWSI